MWCGTAGPVVTAFPRVRKRVLIRRDVVVMHPTHDAMVAVVAHVPHRTPHADALAEDAAKSGRCWSRRRGFRDMTASRRASSICTISARQNSDASWILDELIGR